MTAERAAVISGAGRSVIGRRLGIPDLTLTVDAALRAIADAGLEPADIDGLATYTGELPGPRPGGFFGYSGSPTRDVVDALRLQLNWWSAGHEGPSQLVSLFHAILAVSAGLARHVLVYRTQTETSFAAAARSGGEPPTYPSAWFGDWGRPMHVHAAVNWIALMADRYQQTYGLTPEALAAIVLNNRSNAGLNDAAVYRSPLTLDQYFDSPMVSSPLRLLDCDVPVDGSCALIVSSVSTARDAPGPVARVEAIGTGISTRPTIDQMEDLALSAAWKPAQQMWSRTSLLPSDVDVAYPYDGFSFMVIQWLEALGFCGQGEGGDLVRDASVIGLHGSLPINTDGGHLSAGRTHGHGAVIEAFDQLRGTAGARQVTDAEVAVVTSGGGVSSQGCLLLSRLA